MGNVTTYAAMLDRERIRPHHVELSYLCGRFMVEHLIRVHAVFGGDILAAVVLGTIAQHNARRFYDEVVAKSDEAMDALIARGEHLPHLRPCNAMSVSMATGIPRETVRRKIRWLVQRGWVQQVGRDKLFVTRNVSADFADFDLETLDRVHSMTVAMFTTLHKRLGALPVAAPLGVARARDA
ncbi:MAG: hypothetical protein MUF07_12985 [Steroidobacteraceae bacterium]|nr:hypothetical protein [Steroidobacteraceae bacterium]